MSEQITIAVPARDAIEAEKLARIWAAAEPWVEFREVVSVAALGDGEDPWGEPQWTVVLAVERVEE
jgi:hypothetical protein